MKNIKNFTLIIVVFLGLISCEKRQNAKLEDKQVDLILEKSGVWLVDLFEIDGGDSTTQHFPDHDKNHENCGIKFKPKRDKGDTYHTMNIGAFQGNYYFNDDKTKLLFHDLPPNCPSGTIYQAGKVHNIFLQIPHGDTPWEIITLTSEEFVLKCDYRKNYLVRLTRKSTENQ